MIHQDVEYIEMKVLYVTTCYFFRCIVTCNRADGSRAKVGDPLCQQGATTNGQQTYSSFYQLFLVEIGVK